MFQAIIRVRERLIASLSVQMIELRRSLRQASSSALSRADSEALLLRLRPVDYVLLAR